MGPCTADILLVDDDPGIRKVLAAALQKAGYTVCCAENGREAARLQDEWTIRLVITDIFMPESDGLEFAAKHRATQSHVPIIAMSGGGIGTGSGEMLKVARLFGCCHTLEKPFCLTQLLARVRDTILPAEKRGHEKRRARRMPDAPARSVTKARRNATRIAGYSGDRWLGFGRSKRILQPPSASRCHK